MKNPQTITLRCVEPGEMAFEITPAAAGPPLTLTYQDTDANETKIAGKMQRLLETRRKTVMAKLLIEGFRDNGCIGLRGDLPPPPDDESRQDPRTPKPVAYHAFYSAMQLDGDFVCKINRRALAETEFDELLEKYVAVRTQFFKELHEVAKYYRRRLVLLICLLAATISLGPCMPDTGWDALFTYLPFP